MAFGKKKSHGTSSGPGSESHRLFKKRRDSTGFPWSRCSGPLCIAMLDCATANGAAIMFGSTQGGRGIVLTVFYENDREKEYAGTEEEFAEIAIAVIEGLQSPSEDYLTAYGLQSLREDDNGN